MTRIRLILAALVLALVIYLALSALVVTDGKRVRRVIETGRRAIVNQDADRLMSLIDPTYEDDFGFNHERLRSWFEARFRSYDSIVCRIPLMSVNVDRHEAVCTLAFWFAGYQRGRRAAPADDGAMDGLPMYQNRLVVFLNRFPEGWLIVGASQ
jgi:hypothetical protein